MGVKLGPLTFREARRVMVFQRGVVRGVAGPTGKETTGGSTRLRNEELQNFFSFSNISKASSFAPVLN
jgi:hypothetical protein